MGKTLSRLGARGLLLLVGGGMTACYPAFGVSTHDAAFHSLACADDSECKDRGSAWYCGDDGLCAFPGPDAGAPGTDAGPGEDAGP